MKGINNEADIFKAKEILSDNMSEDTSLHISKIEHLEDWIIDAMIEFAKHKLLKYNPIGNVVYTVQNRKNMLVHGSFKGYDDALKYIDGDLVGFKILECYLGE